MKTVSAILIMIMSIDYRCLCAAAVLVFVAFGLLLAFSLCRAAAMGDQWKDE